jgi:hypothetical protein
MFFAKYTRKNQRKWCIYNHYIEGIDCFQLNVKSQVVYFEN